MLLVRLPTCLLSVAAFFCEVVFQGLLVVRLVGLLLFVKWDVFSRASDLFLYAACFQVLSLVFLFGQLCFVKCFWASRASNLLAVCRCAFLLLFFSLGPVTNPLDCFLIVVVLLCFCFWGHALLS